VDERFNDSTAPAAPPLAIQLGGRARDPETGAITLGGSWPERFEANARIARLGPEENPSCSLSSGYTSGWLSGTLDADILAVEATCAASGDACCSFRAAEPEVWRNTQSREANKLLRQVPFQALREIVAQGAASSSPQAHEMGFDPDDPAVHTWGPVMVLPFTNPDDALATVEMLGRSPDTCSARVVVIDLRGIDLDDDFGAAALEQVLDTIQSWGADAILTGVSQFSEPVVEGLEVAHCVLRKDLSEAVASAFQLADAQRHPL
jgi:anti-anti-sigma regulatory factor